MFERGQKGKVESKSSLSWLPGVSDVSKEIGASFQMSCDCKKVECEQIWKG